MHEITSTAGTYAGHLGVEHLPATTITQIARNVIRNPEERIDALSRDAWREVMRLTDLFAARHWFPPGAEYERLFTAELGGRTLSARIDLLWIDGATAHITDRKTGGRLPKHSDPKITFQGENYAWQVRESGEFPQVDRYEVSEDFMSYGVCRTGVIYADELDETEAFMLDAIARLEEAYARAAEDGRGLKPRRGSWCATCSDSIGCPLPVWATTGGLSTEADAIKSLDAVIDERAKSKRHVANLRSFMDATGLTHLVSGDQEIGHKAKADGGSEFAVRKARKAAEA
jgi:hypothetical protein